MWGAARGGQAQIRLLQWAFFLWAVNTKSRLLSTGRVEMCVKTLEEGTILPRGYVPYLGSRGPAIYAPQPIVQI